MEFFGILGLLIVGWIIFGPFIATHKLKQRVSDLEYKVDRLRRAATGEAVPTSVPSHTEQREADIETFVKAQPPLPSGGLLGEAAIKKPERKETPRKEIDLEQIISTRLGVWVGAVALILGAVFLVKYSIDEGLLSPSVRVTLASLFGMALVGAAEFVRKRPGWPNALRISQGLSGAGFAVLYGAIYAATSLYNFIPQIVGFLGLAGVTVAAIIAALRFGAPVAYLGLFGGYAVPLLVRGDSPDALPLFSYLFILSAMGIVVAARRHWWGMAWGALACAILWLAFWIIAVGSDVTIVLLLFGLPLVLLMAVVTEFLPAKRERDEKSGFDHSNYLNFVSFAAFAAFLFFVGPGNFDGFAWLMSLAMAFAVAVLARLRPQVFAKLLLPMQLALMGLLWRNLGPAYDASTTLNLLSHTTVFVSAFTLLFAGAGFLGMRSAAAPVTHAWLLSSSLLTGFLIAYSKLKGLPSYEEISAFVTDRPGQELPFAPERFDYLKNTWLWGMASLGLGAFFVKQAESTRQIGDSALRNNILAALSIGASGFITASIMLLLPDEMWTIGLALQVLATLWIYERTRVDVLPKLTFGMLVVLTLSGFSRTFGGAIDIMLFNKLNFIGVPSIVTTYFIPAGIIAAGYALAKDRAEWIYRKVYYFAALLVVLGVSYFICNVSTPVAFLEQTLITLVLLTGGALALMRSGGTDTSRSLAKALLLAGLWRLGAFHIITENPLFNEPVGTWPILNAGLFGYVLPVVPLHFAAQSLGWYGDEKRTLFMRGGLTFLFLLGAGYVIRQMFQGSDITLAHGGAGMAEQISYSGLGVITGAALLTLALRLKDVSWRWLSLIVIVLTVGKVFLVDAAHLSGLLRVLSFMGLGLSLFGLSAFYSRYVFKK